MEKMPKAIEARTYDEALAWLREHAFDVTEAPGTNGRVFLRKDSIASVTVGKTLKEDQPVITTLGGQTYTVTVDAEGNQTRIRTVLITK